MELLHVATCCREPPIRGLEVVAFALVTWIKPIMHSGLDALESERG
jgi:hypothetical protein